MSRNRFLLATLLVVFSRELFAVDCSVPLFYRATTRGSTVCIDNQSYPIDSVVLDAVGRWIEECDMGGTKPTLEVGGCGTGDVVVAVEYDTGVSFNKYGTCALYTPNDKTVTTTNPNTGGVITMFKYGKDPFTQQIYPCSSAYPGDALAHELGHALGLDDAPSSSCISHIMGAPSGTYSPTIFPDDCQAVDELWITAQESGSGNGGYDPLYDDTSPGDDGAYDPRGESPIVIDVAGNGIHLTNLTSGVRFDLNADGEREAISWTAGNADDAFLALDRNGNGVIDDGSELFGNYTLQPPSYEPNGFLALAEFDRSSFGGNANGKIDALDIVYARLLLWTDRNHDGLCELEELARLEEGGVESMDLQYKDSKRVDVYGNYLRYRAKVTPVHASPVSHWAWDVFFLGE